MTPLASKRIFLQENFHTCATQMKFAEQSTEAPLKDTSLYSGIFFLYVILTIAQISIYISFIPIGIVVITSPLRPFIQVMPIICPTAS